MKVIANEEQDALGSGDGGGLTYRCCLRGRAGILLVIGLAGAVGDGDEGEAAGLGELQNFDGTGDGPRFGLADAGLPLVVVEGGALGLERGLVLAVVENGFVEIENDGGGKFSKPFGTREELTSPARRNFTTNRPRMRCLSHKHGLVALGLAARAKTSAPIVSLDVTEGKAATSEEIRSNVGREEGG